MSHPTPITRETQWLLALEAGGLAAWEKPDGGDSVVWSDPARHELTRALDPPLRDWLDTIAAESADWVSAGGADRTDAVFHREFRVPAANGSSRTVEAHARLVVDEGSRRWAGIVVDRADDRPAAFLEILAHELRNPLAALLTVTQLARRHGRDRPDLLDSACRTIERQVKQLGDLVGEFSEWSRISRDRTNLPREILELATIIPQALEICRPVLNEQQQECRAGLPETPVRVRSDPIRLAQAIGKLLLSASRFTPEGGTIHLAVVADDRQATIRVRTEGGGFDPALSERVFEPFFQYARPLHSGHTGLGLALAKDWVESLGGKITASSAGHDRESEFVIHLPLAEANPQAAGFKARGR